jgi:hypothetical protein
MLTPTKADQTDDAPPEGKINSRPSISEGAYFSGRDRLVQPF